MWLLVAMSTDCLRYVEVDAEGYMEVCGGKELGERYLLRLVHCMEKLFLDKNKVIPSLVTDVEQHVYKATGKGWCSVVKATRTLSYRLCGRGCRQCGR